jgi:DNA modification methylase
MIWEIIHGDCRDKLKAIASESIDTVITDPPYPYIKRDYGYWTTEEWWELIVDGVIPEVRRILKPTGSAVFILQPNSEHVGQMRGWLWEFMAWVCREWNMIQDVWWWKISGVAPTVHCQRKYGLMRPSLKAMVWCGQPDCYRDQSRILWDPAVIDDNLKRSSRALRYSPSGLSMRNGRCTAVAKERGGVTPFNVLPLSTDSCAGVCGHSAGTPLALADWWTRYIVPPGGVVLDPFCGSGTMGITALQNGCNFIGMEKETKYCEIAEQRLSEPRDVRLL